MTKVSPFIKCVDYWKDHIPPEKLEIYRQLIAEEQIRKHHVIYDRATGSTTVEYYSVAPHEWILEEMRKRSRLDVQLEMEMKIKNGDRCENQLYESDGDETVH